MIQARIFREAKLHGVPAFQLIQADSARALHYGTLCPVQARMRVSLQKALQADVAASACKT